MTRSYIRPPAGFSKNGDPEGVNLLEDLNRAKNRIEQLCQAGNIGDDEIIYAHLLRLAMNLQTEAVREQLPDIRAEIARPAFSSGLFGYS